ncbi:Hypothetical predicted protein [Xyrichtys novacula]|uniref:Uncharacterized protein n=1 Tax=Xyrichtys novacula TaxID=13765 RepID=A0AAV1GUJ3_XYRNO|nr:Hypothetical predicted protein [Xyrichtys novacula]
METANPVLSAERNTYVTDAKTSRLDLKSSQQQTKHTHLHTHTDRRSSHFTVKTLPLCGGCEQTSSPHVPLRLASSNEALMYEHAAAAAAAEKMDICSRCVGLHSIDFTLHAPYQRPPPMSGSSSWAGASAGAAGTVETPPHPQEGGGSI